MKSSRACHSSFILNNSPHENTANICYNETIVGYSHGADTVTTVINDTNDGLPCKYCGEFCVAVLSAEGLIA